MARSLSSVKLEVKLFSNLQNTLDDGNIVNVNHPNLNYKPSLTNGLGVSQANRGWQDLNRTLASGASEDIDLYDLAGIDIGAGSGNDGTGQAIVFEEILAIAIVNNNAVTAAGQLEYEPSAANGWTVLGTNTVATGGALKGQGLALKSQLADTALEVTDASNHSIKFTANGGDVVYSIYILARSDDDESSSISTSESSSSVSTSSSSVSTSSESSISTSSSQSSQSSISTSSDSSLSSSSQS